MPEQADGSGAWDLPLPRVDRRDLLDPKPWRAAEAALVSNLARAAQAVGRLDEAVHRTGTGAIQRLAYDAVPADGVAGGGPRALLRAELVSRAAPQAG